MRVLEVFAPLFGHWQGVEELSESPWGPATTARAMLSFRAEVGGAAMVSDYRQVRADGSEFYGHGVFLVAPDLEVSWWLFDSYAEPPVVATGGWQQGELVLTKTNAQRTAVHRFRIDGEELAYAIDVAIPSGLDSSDADHDDIGTIPFLRGRYRAVSTH